jgi:gliding motility-associated-like protein
LPQLNLASPLLLCPNGTVELNAGINWDVVQWENGVNEATQEVSQPGFYDVTVIDNNCSNIATVEVIAITLPYLELGNDVSICVDDEVTFEIAEPGQWSNGSFSDSFTTSQPGTYGVTIVDGPCSVTDSVSVSTRPLPFVDLPDEIIGCVDQAVVLSASHPNNSGYFWSTEESGPNILVYESGLYSVDAVNDCGTITDQTYVSYEDCSYTLYLPNSFTPDRDGINDVWQIETYNIAKIHFELFNRFGELVVQSEDPFFTWTGEVKEGTHYSPDGLYHYRLSYESSEGDVGTRKGVIFLLR